METKSFIQLRNLKGFKILDVRQFENKDHDRPEFTNTFLKILYFFRYEGILTTLRKYFAHKSRQHRFLTFLVIDFESVRYVNISTQFQTDPDKFVIANQFYRYSDINFDDVAGRVDYYLPQFNQFSGDNNLQLFNIDHSGSITLNEIQQQYFEVKFNNGMFMYGLGGYVRMYIMHHFTKLPKIACIDYKANVSEEFQRKYDFKYGFITADDSMPLLKNVTQPVAIIASYHADHASLAHKIYNQNNNTFIFIEKPPTVTLEDLVKLIELYNKGAKIEIGFNRRFINYSKYVQQIVRGRVVIITCTVKEVNINPSHWYFWKNQGTRITGNCVHWFDLANFWTGSVPVEINLISNPNDPDSGAISVLYKNGSMLNITVSDKGNSLRGVQEQIEIRYDDETIFIDDFISLSHVKRNGRKIRKSNFFRDKGHDSMYSNFRKIISNKEQSAYTVTDLINTSVLTYYASFMQQQRIRNLRIEDEINRYMALIGKTDPEASLIEMPAAQLQDGSALSKGAM
ncbi:MAG: hypothetical protein QM762_25265 [Chryseolinea sp.]